MSSVVSVPLGERSYEIHIAAGLMHECDSLLSTAVATDHLLIVTDETVADLYLSDLLQVTSRVADRTDTLVVPPGENTKCVSQAERLWKELLALNTDRQSTVLALGGGVVGDLAGFAAATFARGLRFVQIPTTLLAQVDSSVGGKVGINLPGAKNMIGAFWQPALVIIDPQVLASLDNDNYRSALAEVVKYGIIMDSDFFEYLERSAGSINARDPQTLVQVIQKCCQLKALIVRQDERETSGRRAILNYGHTFAHAIESVYGYDRFLHGQAVAMGMTCAARLALELQMVDEQFVQRQTQLLSAFGLSVDIPAGKEPAELIEAMRHDKKVSGGQLRLVLPSRIGQVEIIAAPGERQLARSLCSLPGS